MTRTLPIICSLAPFQSYLNLNTLEIYFTEPLQQHLVFQNRNWQKLRSIVNRYRQKGWIQYQKEEGWEMGKLHPLFGYRLGQLLKKHPQEKEAVEKTFLQYCDTVGRFCFKLLDAPDPKQQAEGMLLTQYEYDNLHHALWMALRRKESPIVPFTTLQHYYQQKADTLSRLHLSNGVLNIMADWQFTTLPENILVEYIGMLDSLGEVYSSLNMIEQAEKMHLLALERMEVSKVDKTKFAYFYAGSYHNLGVAANKMGRLKAAQQYFEQALKYYVPEENAFQIGNIHLNLGLMARQRADYPQSKSHLSKALQVFEKLNRRHSMAQVWQNLGVLEDEQGNYGESTGYYKKALVIFEEYNDRQAVAEIEQNLGVIAGMKKQNEASMQHFQKALRLFIELENSYYQGICYRNMGVVKTYARDYDEGMEYLLRALRIFINYDDKPTIRLVLQNMKRLAELSGNYWVLKQAVKYLSETYSEKEMRGLMPDFSGTNPKLLIP